jgi:hypothetical protein
MWPWRKDPFEAIIRRHVDDDFQMFAAGKDAPPIALVEAFERRVGFSLPSDFREYSTSKLGGIYLVVKEELWPRPKENQIGPFWTFLYGLMVYGFAKETPEMMDIRIQTGHFSEIMKGRYAPFLKVIGDADVYCFDENQSIRRFRHETGEMELVPKTFTEVLDFEATELRKRKDRKLSETKLA